MQNLSPYLDLSYATNLLALSPLPLLYDSLELFLIIIDVVRHQKGQKFMIPFDISDNLKHNGLFKMHSGLSRQINLGISSRNYVSISVKSFKRKD
jgi:hypothetical protein